LIIAFGKVAAFALGVIEKKSYAGILMREIVGKHSYVLRCQDVEVKIPLILTYHPSYLFRATNKCWDVYLHLSLANDLLKGA